MSLSSSISDWILQNVEPDSGVCWNWIGTSYQNQPQTTKFRGVSQMIRRLSWFVWKDEELPTKISTTCGNPLCVNPGHLRYQGERV